jgi:hypothetical protein
MKSHHHRYLRPALTLCATLALVSVFLPLASTTGATTSPASVLARQLLKGAILPPGAELVRPTTPVICQCAGAGAVGSLTTLHHYYAVKGSPTSIEKFLTTHLPVGGTYDGSSGVSSGPNKTIYSFTITFPANGPHLYLKQLAYSTDIRNSTSSWLRIDSQIVWLPSRSADQIVPPALSATVTGYKTVSLMGSTGPSTVSVTGKKLSSLVSALNALPLGPTERCVETTTAFQLTITLRNGKKLHDSSTFCGFPEDAISFSSATFAASYELADTSCTVMSDVAALFKNGTAVGTRTSLSDCRAWAKDNRAL